jgi:glycosyltransferase involved in cell wall biosynthesis
MVVADSDLYISIITPCFNEEGNVRDSVTRVRSALEKANVSYEHIFVDNSSTDNTVARLIELMAEDENIRVLVNASNLGAFKSMQRGIQKAQGKFIVPFLAADNQDPPEVITEMIEIQVSTGCDTVAGLRQERKESIVLRSFRRLFYAFLKISTGGNYKNGASEFRLMSAPAAKSLCEIQDETPFLRVYMARQEGRVEYINFAMQERLHGKSSSSFFLLVDDALNGLSLSLPSLFSRMLVFFIPMSLLGLSIFAVGLVGAIFDSFWAFRISIVGLLTSMVFIGLSIQSWMGHYIFMIHAQIRKTSPGETVEITRS